MTVEGSRGFDELWNEQLTFDTREGSQERTLMGLG